MTMAMTAMTKISTGVPGLDSITKGGFPAGRAVVVAGTAGSGKTVLAASSPTGPAFEGAEISSGQRAAPICAVCAGTCTHCSGTPWPSGGGARSQ